METEGFCMPRQNESNLGLTPEQKKLEAEQATRGFYEAIQLRRRYLQKGSPIDETVIKELHRRILKYLNPTNAGVYRHVNVHMSDGAFTPSAPGKIPEKMREFNGQLKGRVDSLSLSFEDVPQVLEAASFAHCQIAKIQPFIDGNKRTARIVTNMILMQFGLGLVSDWGLQKDYFKAFYQSLREEKPTPFAIFLAERLLDRLSKLEWKYGQDSSQRVEIKDKKAVLARIVRQSQVAV